MKNSIRSTHSGQAGFVPLAALIIVPLVALAGALLIGTVSRVNTLTQKTSALDFDLLDLSTKVDLMRTTIAENKEASAAAPQQPQTEGVRTAPSFGSINTVGGTQYFLYGSGVSSSATTLTLTYFYIPVSKQKLAMADFGTIGYLTLEPGSATKQEFVSFTGVTQNADGTATLTGLSRGLSPISPYTASTTLQKQHGGGTSAAISNPPQLYQNFAVKSNDETITGQWTFSTFPITPSNSTSSETVAGVVEMATGAEAADGVTNGSTGRLALPASLATSTYATTTAPNRIVVTRADGTIDPKLLGTTTIALYAGATTTVAGPFVASATSSAYIGAFPAWQIGKQIAVLSSTGTSTFSVPQGITKLSVEVVGGGGGGGSCSAAGSASSAGGGGGAGGYAYENVDVTGSSTIQYFVGSGGGAAAAGTWSTFGTNGFYLSASGGSLGVSEGSGGAGGVGSGGDINISGQGGGAGHGEKGSNTAADNGGAGGASQLGGGGSGGATQAEGGASGNYGGGGGGAGCVADSHTGGTGAQGVVIVHW